MPLPQNTPSSIETSTDFEMLYLAVRALEGRIYSDKELLQLPEITTSHRHYKEWQVRRRSAGRLISYLTKKNKPLYILEVGCGNGWLAAKLAQIKAAKVIALDVNRTEVAQGERVFKKQNLQFFAGSVDDGHFKGAKFDIIIFAASFQYFSPLADTIRKMQQHLADAGEIHLIDSNFYSAYNVDDAVLRTQEYYSAMGYPQMAGFYYHHTLDELAAFNPRVLSTPHSFRNRLLKRSPLYWVRINKENT
ncbi:class I SAM-dependent methyltransferase [Mucilaginibacter psychrotolerans]|uniref:Class I SAM-dependent methyltransferase n=1 Tax=Mucilaginibacter psychrotolerans TaxID=1524096 RepID=A0A4Y8SHV3_9SPHI|nr:class I SAM-dependent methyltransferase [Mucilaginibacter psychrotolerans]TFF38215.1 class I SAM-dependent methyltransferase [Mucilaginibacter psychrotolerans]